MGKSVSFPNILSESVAYMYILVFLLSGLHGLGELVLLGIILLEKDASSFLFSIGGALFIVIS